MEICNGVHPTLTVRDEQDFAACHLVGLAGAGGATPSERRSS
jgi:hypothetical protein